jgi:hypothetical protein
MAKSKETSNFYTTHKKAYIPSRFDEGVCSALIDSEMASKIIKEEC